MAQEYTVALWGPWIDRETDELIRDKHGNFKGSVHFNEDVHQVDATFKTEPNQGDKKYGDIVEYTTQAGKKRLKFQRADRPQEVQASSKPWTPRDDSHIRAQWAIGQAVAWVSSGNVVGAKGENVFVTFEDCAKKFYAMVDRVKGSSESTTYPVGKTEGLGGNVTVAPSGYDKFKASKPMTSKQADRAEDEEIKALLESEAPIDLADIPF